MPRRTEEIMDLMSIQTLAATFLLALSAAGAEPPLPKLRIEPTAGGSIFYVKNVASQPLTAYVIELVDYPGSFFLLFEDEPTSEPIAPGAEKRIQVPNMTVGAAPDYVKVQAAVFADGATAGNAEKLNQVISRRQFALGQIRDLIRRLELMQESKATPEAGAANLRKAIDFMMSSPNIDKASQVAINQAAGRGLFAQTADYLEKHDLQSTVDQLHKWEKIIVESKPAS
jgi:hypothetical protein